jgi:hypothetical protein
MVAWTFSMRWHWLWRFGWPEYNRRATVGMRFRGLRFKEIWAREMVLLRCPQANRAIGKVKMRGWIFSTLLPSRQLISGHRNKREHQAIGISRLAPINKFRGIKMIRSSGPQPAVAGSLAIASDVISMPIIAKSPLFSSKISGQPLQPTVRAPLACGSGPMRRRNSMGLFTPR